MAASTEQAGYSAEVHFAQRLAANEKKVRDRAVKKLRQWISVRSQSDANTFSELDLLKIWKGLFYCMWMSDKPLIQEELAETIANLIHSFKTTSSASMFVDTFFQTVAREWLGIDRLRLDKFLMLVRTCLFHSFEMVKKHDWKPEVVDGLMEVMKKSVLNPELDKIPDGLIFHVCDIYLGELTKVGGQMLSPQETLKFVEPFCVLAAQTPKPIVLTSVLNEVFKNGIIFKSDVWLKDIEDEETGSEENGKEVDDEKDESEEAEISPENAKGNSVAEKRKLVFDYQALSECLYKYASDSKVLSKRRTKLYEMVKKLQDLAQGTYPVDTIDLKLLKVIDEEEGFLETQMKRQKQERRKKWRENKKARKRKLSEESHDSSDDIGQESSPKAKKKKKSNKMKEDERNNIKHLKASEKSDTASVPEQGSDEVMKENVSVKRKKMGKKKDTDQSVKKDSINKKKPAESEKPGSEIDNLTSNVKEGGKKAAKTRRAKKEVTNSMHLSTEGIINVTEEANTKAFVEFKKVTVPAALVRRAYKKMNMDAAEKKKVDSQHATPPQKKKVEFVLTMNTSQDPKEYKEQVRKSPVVPFDKEKKPSSSVLKTPEHPVVKRKSTRKKKKLVQS